MSGLVSHIELMTADPARARAFYSRVFGWECMEYELAGKPYVGWRNPEGGVPGGFRRMEQGQQPGIVNYVKTYDMDGVLAKVRERGGRVILERTPLPGIGWMARFIDPYGNMLGLFQPE